jgi:pentatricopeptide repeat protein
VKEVHN